MADKDADSIVDKQIEYASSEYSAAPPAYKMRSANSVKIAKIIAFTIVLSSFILGSFILASTYLQTKAACDQASALTALLDKELMLETMQQDLPRQEALLSPENSIHNNLQDLSKDEMRKPNKKDDMNPEEVENISDEGVNDFDVDENGDRKRVHVKLPLDFDLSELAHNILMNNQKSKMNCVVERRKTEEVDEQNPFIAFMQNKPKKVTGERIAIFCETGEKSEPEPTVQIRRIVMPFPFLNNMQHRMEPQLGPFSQMGPKPEPQQPRMENSFPVPPMSMPPRFPPHFMPQNQMNMPPPQMNFQPPPFRQQNFQFPQQLPPFPAVQMSPPRPEVPQFRLINPAPQNPQITNFERPAEADQQQPEIRIHLRRIQLPGDILPILNNIQAEQNQDRQVQMQQVPLAEALSKVGITPEDLKSIQRMAEEKFQEHIRELVAAEDENGSFSSDETDSEIVTESAQIDSDEDSSKSEEQKKPVIDEQKKPQILALGRSLNLTPIQLPSNADGIEKADFAQPR